MKRYIYVILLGLVVLAGCQKDEQPTLRELICGEWRGNELSVEAGIYINLNADGTFELYQRLEGESFELRRGTWTLNEDILSGVYNDSEAWSATYKVEVTGNNLRLTSQDDSQELNIYIRCGIPSAIRDGAEVVVKSHQRMLNSQPQ